MAQTKLLVSTEQETSGLAKQQSGKLWGAGAPCVSCPCPEGGEMCAGLISPARGAVCTDGAVQNVQNGSAVLGERYQCQR